MPARRRTFVRRRIGRAGIVRRVSQFARDVTFRALVDAGQEARKEYRQALANHRETGLLQRSVRLRRSKRLNLVRVGIFPKESQTNAENRTGGRVTTAQKAVWLEFGTRNSDGSRRQRPRPILLPIYRRVSSRVSPAIRRLWNREVDIVFSRLERSVHLDALRRRIRL